MESNIMMRKWRYRFMRSAAAMILLLVVVSLAGCYAVGHEYHTDEQHARMLQRMNDPEANR